MSARGGRQSLEASYPGIGARMVKLYNELGSGDKVARELRCGKMTVYRTLQRLGVDTSRPPAASNRGKTESVACAACGITRMVNPTRGFDPLCSACKTAQHAAAELPLEWTSREPVIEWRRDRHGIYRGTVIEDADPIERRVAA